MHQNRKIARLPAAIRQQPITASSRRQNNVIPRVFKAIFGTIGLPVDFQI